MLPDFFAINHILKTIEKKHQEFEASIAHLHEDEKEFARRLYRGGDKELRHRELCAAIKSCQSN